MAEQSRLAELFGPNGFACQQLGAGNRARVPGHGVGGRRAGQVFGANRGFRPLLPLQQVGREARADRDGGLRDKHLDRGSLGSSLFDHGNGRRFGLAAECQPGGQTACQQCDDDEDQARGLEAAEREGRQRQA